MKLKRLRRLWSIVLALVMIAGLLPAVSLSVKAAENEEKVIIKEVRTWEELCDAFTLDNTLIDQDYTQKVVLMDDLSKSARDCLLSDTRMVWINVNPGNYILDFNGHTLSGTDDVSSTDLESYLSDFIKIQLYYDTKLTFTDSVGGGGIRMYSSRAYDNQLSALHIISLPGYAFDPSISVVFDGGEYSLTAKTSKFGRGTLNFDDLYRGCVVVDAVNATVNDGIFTAKSEGIVSKGDDMCARELSAFATCITDYSTMVEVAVKGKVQTGYTVINGGMFQSDGYSIHHFDDARRCDPAGDFASYTVLDSFGYCLYPTIHGGAFIGPMGFTGKTFTYSDGSDEVNDRPASEIIQGESVIGRDGDNDIFDHIREMSWKDLHELNYCFVLGEEVVGYEVTPESEGTEEGYELLERYDSESDVFEIHYRTPIWFEESGLSLSPTITVDNKETAGDEKEYPVSRKLLNWSDYYKGPVLVKTKLALHGITGNIAFTKDYMVKLSSGMPRLDPPTITTWNDNELRWEPVANAKSYIVELEYYTMDDGNKVYGTPIIRTPKDTELFLPNFLFTKDMMVKASVTAVPASGSGYSDSRPAETEERAGWYNKQTLENVQLADGILTWESLDTSIGSRIYSWIVTVKDSNGTIVDTIKYDKDTTSANLGADFAKNGIAQGDYTISLHAEVFGPVSKTWSGAYSYQSYAITPNSPSNGSYTVLSNGTEVSAAPAGSWITIRLSPDAGYTVDQVKLSGAGSGSLTVSDNEAEFMMPKGDVGINVSFKEAESYTVTDDCTNCRVIPTNGSYLVSSGSSFSFRIEPDAYYEIVPSKFLVDVFAMIDGEGQGLDVIEEDGVYTVENVTTNLEISRSTNGLIGYADIVIGPGDGQGQSVTKKMYQGEKLTLTDPVSDPEYGFTAPEGYEFKEWKITYPNGNITTGAVGKDLNIKSGEYHLKAIWKPLYQIDVINGAAYKDAERTERIFRASEDTTVYLDYFPVEGEKVFDIFTINKNDSSSILHIDSENHSFAMVPGDLELEATYVTMIDTVEVQNVVKPAGGVVFEEYQETVEETAGYAKGYVTWYDITAENSLNDGESFIGNHTYQISIMLSEKKGYEFDSADKMNLVLAGIPESDYQVISVEATGSDYMKFVVEMVADEKPVAVTGISLQKSISLNVAESVPLEYTVLPDKAKNKKVFFVSDNSSVVSVDYATGVARGIGEGTAVITATTEDGEFKASCKVTVICEHVPDREYPTPKDPVACTLCGKELEPALYQIDEIPDLAYTGKALKPTVNVYHEGVLLKAGTDYTVTYVNNIKANAVKSGVGRMQKVGDGVFASKTAEDFNPKLPYVIISGKSNYQRDVYVNFNITAPVIGNELFYETDDVVLKYTANAEANGKAFKPFTSIKYGKLSMKAGVDYSVKVTKEGSDKNLLNSKGQMTAAAGTYKMTIKGLGSFDGEIVKTITVAEKSTLLNNAQIKLNVKSKEYDYQDLDANGTTLNDKDYVVTIKNGKVTKELKKGVDFDVSYAKNDRVGTATLILQGKGSYVGTKTIEFKITGRALTAKNVKIKNLKNKPYTGESIEQSAQLELRLANGSTVNLVEGTDYTVAYAKNVNKGKASITFTGNALAGYSGSIKSSFTITEATLTSSMLAPIGNVAYSKAGAIADEQIILTHGETRLVKDKDYTLKYSNNKDLGDANVAIIGKGNYKGTLNKKFVVQKQDIANTLITMKPLAYKATEGYVYKPSVTVKDGKSSLKAGTDYTVEFSNPSKDALEAWFAGNLEKAPKLQIKAVSGSCYVGSVEVTANIFKYKLSGSNAYVKVNDRESIYDGSQQIPQLQVYYSSDKAVIKALKDAEKSGTVTTVIAAKLRAGTLTELTNGIDYTVSGGKNILAGFNKGTVKVTGIGTYSGNVSAKFSIQRKDIWWYEMITSLIS